MDISTASAALTTIKNEIQISGLEIFNFLKLTFSSIWIWLLTLGTVYAGFVHFSNAHQIISSLKTIAEDIKEWINFKYPARKVLQTVASNNEALTVFVRDFYIRPNTLLLSREGLNGPIGQVPNVLELWPRVEGISLSRIFGTLGKLNKTKDINIVEMGKDMGIWNTNIIVLGAQTQKCFDFYSKMNEVAYKVTNKNIIDNDSHKRIYRAKNYGYGIIIKCKNPHVLQNGIGFLIGGFGTLGTEAAAYYFSKNLHTLGKVFGNNSFGIVVRASITAGVESTERIEKYDKVFK